MPEVSRALAAHFGRIFECEMQVGAAREISQEQPAASRVMED
jgi:hypothetical protein